MRAAFRTIIYRKANYHIEERTKQKWETIQRGPFEPTWESLRQHECPDWFRDAKFGIWSHGGPQSVPMFGDWYARHMYIEGSAQYIHH